MAPRQISGSTGMHAVYIKRSRVEMKRCKKCGYLFPAQSFICTRCGTVNWTMGGIGEEVKKENIEIRSERKPNNRMQSAMPFMQGKIYQPTASYVLADKAE